MKSSFTGKILRISYGNKTRQVFKRPGVRILRADTRQTFFTNFVEKNVIVGLINKLGKEAVQKN